MSGTALTTVSPSRVKMRRSVVCVAGCCGPKLSVHRYSCSAPSAAISDSAKSSGMFTSPRKKEKVQRQKKKQCSLAFSCFLPLPFSLSFGPCQHREIVPFPAAAQGIILTEGEGCELFRHQDAAQIRMPLEHNSIHVKHLALHPVRALP